MKNGKETNTKLYEISYTLYDSMVLLQKSNLIFAHSEDIAFVSRDN